MDTKSANVRGGVHRKTLQGSGKTAQDHTINFDQKNEQEKVVVEELKKIYAETIKLDVELQTEIYKLEKSFERKYTKLFDKRLEILEDFKAQMKTGDGSTNPPIYNFWLQVLKLSYPEFITEEDEKILAHLTDLRSEFIIQPSVEFIISFKFEPNEYFSNRVLTKTYFLKCTVDPENPLSYDGAEIYRCEGCKIDWKPNYHVKQTENSFFDFFDPPLLPSNPNEAGYCEINAILQNDYELGFYLKERVIPKAILFYTGEIVDCQGSDTSSEDDDDENEDRDTNDHSHFSSDDNKYKN